MVIKLARWCCLNTKSIRLEVIQLAVKTKVMACVYCFYEGSGCELCSLKTQPRSCCSNAEHFQYGSEMFWISNNELINLKPQILAWLLTPIHNVVFFGWTKCDCSVPVQPDVSVFKRFEHTHTNTEHSMCIFLCECDRTRWSPPGFWSSSTVVHWYFMWHVRYIWEDLLEIPPQRKPHTCTQT